MKKSRFVLIGLIVFVLQSVSLAEQETDTVPETTAEAGIFLGATALTAKIFGKTVDTNKVCPELRKQAKMQMRRKCDRKGYNSWEKGEWTSSDCKIESLSSYTYIKLKAVCVNRD